MEKSKNELIEKRRKKIRRKRIFGLMVFLIAVLITLSIELPYFKIQNIKVYNNNRVSSDEIIKASNIEKDSNIFYININKVKDNILDNPYILSVQVKRKLPNSLNIYVQERNAVFYAEKGKKYAIIDKNGICLEIKDTINNMNLIKLIGVDTSKVNVGNVIPVDDKRKLSTISTLTDIIAANNICKNINTINIQDEVNIVAYYNKMEIKLGSSDNILSKLNRAINIINGENLTTSTGYVDVSYNGNPVYSIDK
jgi:cell division protein FtsQ